MASAAALAVALVPGYVAVIDGRYIPVGNDSFYHARRILDMLADPTNLYQFDSLIHFQRAACSRGRGATITS